ncbi:MAG: OsmC family protein [Streptococcaceae bacterium]|jgi:uncharacterized OsmC-like protein|nr:OsmC family protein [Streptococcaceae bacterium]
MSSEKLIVTAENDQLLLVREGVRWVLKKETGYCPMQMVAAAAAACCGYVLSAILKRSMIPFVLDRVEAVYDRDEEKPARPISAIALTFYVKVEASDQDRVTQALKSVAPTCPVIQSLDPAIELTEAIVFVA